MIAILIFCAAYLTKGGQFFASKGKAISFLIVFAFVFYDTHDLITAALITAAWALAIAPSMGEEAGAIGRIGHAWGRYIDWMPKVQSFKMFGFSIFEYREGRWYGLNKGVQRGAWIGAIFSIALGHAALFVPVLAVGFVAAHFIGQELYFRIHKMDDWKYSEALLGALIGLCYHLSSGA